jgi:DNA replication and repair protein RecF
MPKTITPQALQRSGAGWNGGCESVSFSHAPRVPPERRSVRLSALALRRFRNLANQDLEIPPEGLALVGDNAQGKSNFLEAIYYLETFRSFRGARDEQLLGFGEDVFRVAGTAMPGSCDDRESTEVAAAFERRGKRKKVSLDGKEAERLGDAIGRLAAVIFSPADVELVSGGPRERRRFLDIVLSLNEGGYLDALQTYRRVLASRNASLKEGQSGATVAAWDPGLISAGAAVIDARRQWIEGSTGAFGDYYASVSGEARARMTYRPSVPLGGARGSEQVAEAFRNALVESHDRDRRLGTTTVGPHRDDVRLDLEGEEGERLDLRDYGSGGQRRTAALALRLVEAKTIRERRRATPLILLDDVFAELDAGRSERVLHVMEGEDAGQVLLTAPKEADVRLRRDTIVRWRIDSGRIHS